MNAEPVRPIQKPQQFRIPASELLPLSVRNDRHALAHAAGHLGAIIVTGSLLWHFLGTVWAVPLTLLQGYFVAFLFTAEHETAHHTAFKTRALNDILGHFAGFAILLPYEYYRAFHWDHHRYTNDPAKDPELARPLPRTRGRLAWYLTGIPTWIDRVRMLYIHGVLGRVDKPWVAENKRALIRNEARWYLLGYAVIIAVSVATQSMAAVWLWIVPLMTGLWFLRPYLLAEHTGCAHTPNMLENTRTTYTNGFVRYFAWNMPYHVEHHAYPSVPFHALPALNERLASHIVTTAPGYVAATGDVMTAIAANMDPTPQR